MGRICRVRTTGKIIEYQDSATPGTLIRNAVVAGFAASEVEEVEVTPLQWTTMLTELRTSENATRARCLSFARTIHLYLDGTTALEKFNRGLALRGKAPALVGVFVNDLRLAGDAARRGALAAIRSSWTTVKHDPVIGVEGSDGEHLTATEASKIEVGASTDFGIELV